MYVNCMKITQECPNQRCTTLICGGWNDFLHVKRYFKRSRLWARKVLSVLFVVLAELVGGVGQTNLTLPHLFFSFEFKVNALD